LVALVSSDNARAVGVVFPARVAFAVACAQAVQHGRVPPACAIRSAIVSFALTSLSLVRRRRAGPPCTFASLRAQLVWPYLATGEAGTVVFRPPGWSPPIATARAEILFGPTQVDLPVPQPQGDLRQYQETRRASVAQRLIFPDLLAWAVR